MNDEETRKAVREHYGEIAEGKRSCCGPAECCSTPVSISREIGYSEAEMGAVPEGANLGLGCGNPVALASLRAGEAVLDLGSGAGFDCFLAAPRVGPGGRVIGVDMTASMLEKARANASRGGFANVEFRLGEIEHLPVADGEVDAVISNCVINLSPDKPRVFREAYRALKPGGRLMVSDMVLLKELPQLVKDSVEAYAGCIAGASLREDYLSAIRKAGFEEVEVLEEKAFPVELMAGDLAGSEAAALLEQNPGLVRQVAESVVSIALRAVKPKG